MKRRHFQIIKITIASLFIVGLAFLGLRGSQHARLLAKLDDVVKARDQLLVKMDEPDWSTGRDRGAVTNAGIAALSSPEVKGLANILETKLRQFDFEYPEEISGIEGLEVRLSRATLANAQQRFGEAVTVVTEADERRYGVNMPRVLQVRGDACFGLRKWQETLTIYRSLLGLPPVRIGALDRATQCYAALGRTQEAWAMEAELARAYSQRGHARIMLEKFDPALEDYDKAIQIRTRLLEGGLRQAPSTSSGQAPSTSSGQAPSTGSGQALADELALNHHNRGDALLIQGKLTAAVGHYEKALELQTRLSEQEPGNNLSVEIARSQHALANALLGQGKGDSAAGHYDKAIELLTPILEQAGRGSGEAVNDLAKSYNNRGVLRRVQGNLEAAFPDFENALRILGQAQEQQKANARPNQETPDRTQVRVDVAMGYSEKTLDALIRTRFGAQAGPRDLAVTHAMSLKNRGYARLGQAQPGAAVADFKHAADIYANLVEREGQNDLRPEYSKSLVPIAWTYATNPDNALRNAEQARQYALRACELSEWKAFGPLETLAAASAEAGDFPAAVTWQEKALALAPSKQAAEPRSRMDLYKAGKPYRTPAAKAP